jgi:ferric-dicitrate binding protein FerR (iron transport regulator)
LLLLTSGRATVADARALRQWCAQSPNMLRLSSRPRCCGTTCSLPLKGCSRLRQFGRRAFLGGAIAASAAFLLVRGTIPGGFEGLGADYITEVGQQRRFEPADGVSGTQHPDPH